MRYNTESHLRHSFFHAQRASAALGVLLLASAALGCNDSDEPNPLPPVEPTALQKAINAIGGQEALDGLRALSFEATGSSSVIDEGFEAGGQAPQVSTYKATVTIDIEGGNMRVSHERDSLVMVPGAKNTFSEIIAGQVGFILGNELVFGAAPEYVGAPMSSARWASVRKQQRLSNPHMLLRGLAEADVTDGGFTDVNGASHHRLVIPDPEGIYDITLLVNAETGVISGLSTMESDHLRGDVELAMSYERWELAGNVSVPRTVTITLEGVPVNIEERTAVEANPEIPADLFAFPEGAEPQYVAADALVGELNAQHHQRFMAIGTAPFFDGPNTTVAAAEIGQGSGIYHLIGAGHHSLLIDQGDTLVLVEAPLHAARSEAILAWIDANLEGGLAANPISHVISTHHHADHSAGLRTFAMRGATIVVAESSKDFMADVFASSRTLDPAGALENQVIEPDIINAVAQGGSFTIGNVTAHHIQSAHAADMLIVHVDNGATGDIVFNSDLYLPDLLGILPGSVFVQGGTDLDDGLVALGLNDDTTVMLGGHGNINLATGEHFVVSYADFKAQLDVAQGLAGQ